ncbi:MULTISPECIES: hypothetical protein [Haloferax]|uniref:hypothetical protein n=1 Tax=Haloferax TaxID=2251 RepID=UPI003743222F
MAHPYHNGFVPLSWSVVDDADCPRSRSNRFDFLDPPVREELLVERVRLLRDDDRFERLVDVDDRLEAPRDERVREDVLDPLDDPVDVLADDRFEDVDREDDDVRPDEREEDDPDVDDREDDDRAEDEREDDDRDERDEDEVDRDVDGVDRDEEDDELVDVLPLPACPGNLNLVRPSSRFST